MLINAAKYGYYLSQQNQTKQSGQTGPAAAAETEAAALIEAFEKMQQEAQDKEQTLLARLEQENNKKNLFDIPTTSKAEFQIRVSKPSDNSAKLTQRLVAANSESEVSGVIAEASQSLVNLRIVAALGKPEDAQKARAIIQRINKLLKRASGKIMDLRNEQTMKSQEKRATEERKRAKAEKIKTELRQKQKKRHIREGWYLQESALNKLHDDMDPLLKEGAYDRLDVASEAAIAAQAEVMADVEVAVESGGGVEAGGEGGGDAGGEGGSVSMDIVV